MKIVVTGGGTGGHIYPALALIRTIKQQYPETEFTYIGTEKGLEAEIVPRENIPFESIHITGFRRSLSFENVKTIFRFLKGVKDSKHIFKKVKPDIVIGTGGYVCGPVVYAAAKKKIPTIIHEQNSVPGLTNKFLSRYVDKVAVCFEEVKEFFPEDKAILTGNPRASEVIGKRKPGALAALGLKEGIPTVLITGGSRGARPINDAVVKSLSSLSRRPYQVIYVTGQVHYDHVMEEAKLVGKLSNIAIVPFIHEMQTVLSSVDGVVGRAGATSLAEITAIGLPSILIPSPYVTNNHQEKNAQTLVEHGAAIMLLERELSSKQFLDSLDSIMLNDEKRKIMGEQSRKLGIRDASKHLSDLMFQLVKQPQ
ncbi:UDP-N-acetylglucosamine--N-acetylmuramyl-(pentapeptide) pyrophosphoryl-undecaprenol N-acetylglucosamine transferase [Bacillus sp. J14TS2]|uniref:undecaprenyldiphospho-muramoylpentapeptide beta-N-acetylglucosaminyltransferase n=1 Tax=Bacillus sp. J14TS2 TaxID=2807188 RepID=UPI001B26512F|nr:undecaprenyldiphospho-muramoylpentapeptide beta-N-acetylglucosaminyltransferase [Bacillus sp. J14TS2]GIN74372.1 UDP-N-acetylglucosamine--N-acetylmuramyl-(pentapeptide) pyrophosphoryl-undecaprenol N-acetylglucosamine transferase [Bacillus sp. J14TS2]